MKTILKIGYQQFLLPASANVNTLLKALSEAQPVESNWHESGEMYRPSARERCDVEVKMIRDNQWVDPKKAKRIPEQAGPDANGRDITRRD